MTSDLERPRSRTNLFANKISEKFSFWSSEKISNLEHLSEAELFRETTDTHVRERLKQFCLSESAIGTIRVLHTAFYCLSLFWCSKSRSHVKSAKQEGGTHVMKHVIRVTIVVELYLRV